METPATQDRPLGFIRNQKTVITANKIILWLTGVFLLIWATKLLVSNYLHQFQNIAGQNILGLVFRYLSYTAVVIYPMAIFKKNRICAALMCYVCLPAFVLALPFISGYVASAAAGSSIALPEWFTVTQYSLETLLGVAIPAAFMVFNGLAKAPAAAALKYLSLVCLGMIPLNIFEQLSVLFTPDALSFITFRPFGLWHLIAIAVLIGLCVAVFRANRGKTKEEKWMMYTAVTIVLMVQYAAKFNYVLSVGYHGNFFLRLVLPFYMCDLAAILLGIAVFTKRKFLLNMSFFISSACCISVFFFPATDQLPVINHTPLYFFLSHAAIVALALNLGLLGLAVPRIKRIWPAFVILAVFLLMARVATDLSHITVPATWEDGTEINIFYTANYGFTVDPPFLQGVFNVGPAIKPFGYDIYIVYQLLLTAAYCVIFLLFYGLYLSGIGIVSLVTGKNLLKAGSFTQDEGESAQVPASGKAQVLSTE